VNLYDIAAYKRKLEAIGFINFRCQTIEHHIYPQHHAYTMLRLRGRTVENAVVPDLTDKYKQWVLNAWGKYGFSRYVIITADKPKSAARVTSTSRQEAATYAT
jgi:hypothetical protein